MAYDGSKLPKNAIGLKLHRIKGNRLLACESVFFVNGRDGVDTVLRRAQLAGRVEVAGEIKNHFADVLTSKDGDWDETIALDSGSYSALKNHWMRCRLQQGGPDA